MSDIEYSVIMSDVIKSSDCKTFQKGNNKVADQTAPVLLATPRRQFFSRRGPYVADFPNIFRG